MYTLMLELSQTYLRLDIEFGLNNGLTSTTPEGGYKH